MQNCIMSSNLEYYHIVSLCICANQLQYMEIGRILQHLSILMFRVSLYSLMVMMKEFIDEMIFSCGHATV